MLGGQGGRGGRGIKCSFHESCGGGIFWSCHGSCPADGQTSEGARGPPGAKGSNGQS